VAEDRPVEVTTYLRAATRRDELMSGTSLGRTTGTEPPVRAEAGHEPTPGAIVNPAEEAATRRTQAVEAKAREIDPETFSRYDALSKERETYKRWVGELAETRRQTAEASVADLDRQIADAQERLGSADNKRKAKTYQKRLDEMQAERSARVDQAVSRDSPDMAKVRQKLQDADITMRDLAEKVSAAKRQADSEIPDGTNQVSGLYDVTDPWTRPMPA
jgi:chromosome segregation ATPase